MPTIAQQPIDIQWIVSLASGTSYIGAFNALAAAVVLSAASSNAPVQIASVDQQATNTTGTGTQYGLSQVNMVQNPVYVVQLQGGTTYYPLATALTQAYTLSASNSNVPVYISRVVAVVTAP